MKYKTEKEVNGWSEWIHPVCKPSYRMACCDCGLIHDMQFKVVKYRGQSRIIFRASRNNRATSAMRRKFKSIKVIKKNKPKPERAG